MKGHNPEPPRDTDSHIHQSPPPEAPVDIADTRQVPQPAAWKAATLPSDLKGSLPAAAAQSDGGKSFLLTRLVAEGGIGEVWEALQTSLDRTVAVKRIQPRHYERLNSTGNHAELLAHQFQQEAVITAHLEHPNIIPVYDLGNDADGNPLLAMKLVRGTPWDFLIDDDFDHLDRDQYFTKHLPILISMAQAVAFAHSKGIIHRDLKPSQVMVGEFGEVLLMDWGLAMVVDVERASSPALVEGRNRIPTHATATSPAGTPSMMAPEQTLDSAIAVSTRTDIYLLGGTLYYLLTGFYPHEAATSDLSIEHARNTDILIPRRDAKDRPIPNELAQIATRALQRDPTARFSDVEEFIESLQGYLTGSGRRRESLEITHEAKACLSEHEETLLGARILRASRADIYEKINYCLNLIDQAMSLWPNNPEVPPLRETLLRHYATAALAHDDLALSRIMTLRMQDEPARLDLLQRIERKEAHARREKSQRALGLAAAAVLAILLLIGSLQYALVMGRKTSELEAQRSELERASVAARVAELKAVRESDLANAARLAAEQEQYFGSIMIARTAFDEGRVEKASDLLLNRSPLHSRNWEWGHLMATLHPEDLLIEQTVDFFHGAFAANGLDFILSTSGELQVFSRATGGMRHALPISRGIIWSFDISPDGTLAATASFDARINIVRLSDGAILHTFPAPDYQRVARFSPDGRRLLTGGADNRFTIYDVDTGNVILQSEDLSDHVYCAAWNPDGTQFVIGVRRTAVLVFDATTAQPVQRLMGIEDNTLGVRWSRDGTRILTASADRTARLFDVATGEIVQSFLNPGSWLHDADLSPDGTLVATADDAGACRIFDVETGMHLGTLKSLGPMFKVVFSPEGTSVLTVSSREARIARIDSLTNAFTATPLGELAGIQELPQLRVYGVPASRDRNWNSIEGAWNVPSGGTLVQSQDEQFVVRSRYAALDPEGEWIAIIDPNDSGATIRTFPGGELLAVIGDEPMIDVAVDPTGRYLALAEDQKLTHLISTETWALIKTFPPEEEHEAQNEVAHFINQVLFSPDGSTLAIGYVNGCVGLWDVSTRTRLHHWVPEAPSEFAGVCIAFSPDGRTIASGGARAHVVLRDVESGEILSTLVGHERTVYCLAFSPDGSRIVTSSRDQSVRLWETHSGREVLLLHQGTQVPLGLGFSNEGQSIAIAMSGGGFRLLDSFPADPAELPGNDSMSVKDRYELWKRIRRLNTEITPTDIRPAAPPGGIISLP
jgi:WD40 repeat protein/serine/threonine protein kinase